MKKKAGRWSLYLIFYNRCLFSFFIYLLSMSLRLGIRGITVIHSSRWCLWMDGGKLIYQAEKMERLLNGYTRSGENGIDSRSR